MGLIFTDELIHFREYSSKRLHIEGYCQKKLSARNTYDF